MKAGDRVKIAVEEPTYGWGEVAKDSVGVYYGKTRRPFADPDDIVVAFPEQIWVGKAADLELVEAGPQECGGLKVGDRVKVVVAEPKYGWGSVSPDEVGLVDGFVTDVNGGEGLARVDFPSALGWSALVEELEVVNGEA